ncbi:photosynthetic NDH subunit of lumenal location 2, chloroplastic [Corylus avellana]|uniref:photosynthetic NDH subunit of lumenal location 2, chloroplastic n=1 Tax=Corylus avellana TaxID=13451 RepID=UPI00286A1FFA|nr:photosynthetic NDH subunit of lumenal location 2, chloroplastic [Corylus avellana]
MSSFTHTTTPLQPQLTKPRRKRSTLPRAEASFPGEENVSTHRRQFVTTLFATTSMAALGLQGTPQALAQNWGTRSFIRERFFEPGLSPEDAVARIRQTAEGLHSIREMLETMSWRYVIFYIRLKQAYLSQDLKNAITTLPEGRRNDYVKTANELVDNMLELDYYVRTPKVYESYLYYEKTLKSIDDLVALFV